MTLLSILDQHIVDWQDHERQEIIDHTKNNGIWCVDDFQSRQMQKTQNTVDNTVLFEQSLPRQCTQKKIHPHRQNKNEYNKACLVDLLLTQDHCQRIGQEADRIAVLRKDSRMDIPSAFRFSGVVICARFANVKLPSSLVNA